jgi:ATP-dependent helicase HrpA
LAKQSKGKPMSDEILDVRWMMEEFRVSVFAQNLKTAYPVSAKRILNYLRAISAN